MPGKKQTRRTFIIKACWATLGTGALTAGISLKSCSNFFSAPNTFDILNDSQKDRLAFAESVYPFFTKEELNLIRPVVNKLSTDWEVINNTFFNFYRRKSQEKPFNSLASVLRESLIAEFIHSASPDDLSLFDKSRIRITGYIIENGFFPYSSFGYPDVRTEPFIADPSWEICHLQPFHKVS